MAVQIIKEGGDKEIFDSNKLRRSLRRAGANDRIVEHIVEHIEEELIDGMTTSEIYRNAFALLEKEEEKPVAARYSLKRAVMDLGPSGFAFEFLLGELFRSQGYRNVETGVVIPGRCVEHEVDLIAENDDSFVIAEAKFHNKSGFKTDLKVALYVDARSMDLAETNFGGRRKKGLKSESWLITNTKFTRNAINYGECVGMKMIAWGHPSKGNLHEIVEASGLHPLSCLTTLSGAEKQLLFERGTVLCRSIKDDARGLSDLGINDRRVGEIMGEAKVLCQPGKAS